MKLKPDKCHLILNTKQHTTLKRGNLHIKKNAFSKKLLGMSFDYKLTFTKHIEDSCQKSSGKINALAPNKSTKSLRHNVLSILSFKTVYRP